MPTTVFRIVLEDTSVCAGDEFLVHVTVDAPEAAINAAQGALTYNPSHLTPVTVRYGDSFLRYWVTSPALPSQAGSIPFTGGLPYPGFMGSGGKIMSIVFRADSPNVNTIVAMAPDAQALLNDGQGTATSISYQEGAVSIIAGDAATCRTGPSQKVFIDDTDPPEPFEVIITREEKIFNGAHFAAFDTVDSETGVSHYEVRESSQFITTPWQNTRSPYRLHTQGGDVLIHVRAVDGAGNIRLASTSANLEPIPAMFGLGNAILLLAAAIIAAVIFAWCRRRGRGE